MADIFVSYKREDRSTVQTLVQALRSDGFAVWWDQDIPPDAPWEATVERELRAANAVIVAWSPKAIQSDAVKAEARQGRNRGRLIQTFIEPCEPPLFFGERQGIDLTDWAGDATAERYLALAGAARAILAGERPADAVGYTPEKASRFIEVATSIALAVCILVIIPLFRSASKPDCRGSDCEREAILAGIAGVWGNPAGPGQAACTTTLTYWTERRGEQDYVRLRGEGFESEGVVASAGGASIFTRTTRPSSEAGTQWELRLESDRLIQVDSANTPTPLVRCDP